MVRWIEGFSVESSWRRNGFWKTLKGWLLVITKPRARSSTIAFNDGFTSGPLARGASCGESDGSSEAEEVSDAVLKIRCFFRRCVIADEVEEALKKDGECDFSQCRQNQ
jgi:hypothetical protein